MSSEINSITQLYGKYLQERKRNGIAYIIVGVVIIVIGFIWSECFVSAKDAARSVIFNVSGGAFVGFGVSCLFKDRSTVGHLLRILKDKETSKSNA